MVNGIFRERHRGRKILPGDGLRRRRILPAPAAPRISTKPSDHIEFLLLARALQRRSASRRLGERRLDDEGCRLGGLAPPSPGEQDRWRTRCSIGLSRQIALHRELDVVANNIANLNTTGFKADGAVFAGIPDAGRAARATSSGTDRRLSFVQDRATWHDFEPGHDPADRQSARRRHRRRWLPGGADAARRALHPQRRAADQRHRPARHRRRRTRCSAKAARSCSRTPTATSPSPRTARSRCARAPTQVQLRARQAAAGALRQRAAAAEGRRSSLSRRPTASCRSRCRRRRRRVSAGLAREIERARASSRWRA